jgi:hypothetical protein
VLNKLLTREPPVLIVPEQKMLLIFDILFIEYNIVQNLNKCQLIVLLGMHNIRKLNYYAI